MHMIPKLLWQMTILILWINPDVSISENPCENISKKGKLVLTAENISKLDAFCECEVLQKIRFKDTRKLSIPFCLSANEHLTEISFAKNPIQRLPEGIEQLKQLKKLDLSFTEIVYLSDFISELTNLKTLNLRGTQIEALPDGLDHLEKIDMRMIDLNRQSQDAIRAQYPSVKIYFSSPCQCK